MICGKLKFKEGNLSKDILGFQIEGNTILHLLSLNTDFLNLVLEYFNDNCQEYLNAILQQNLSGVTPLDITTENDSPK